MNPAAPRKAARRDAAQRLVLATCSAVLAGEGARVGACALCFGAEETSLIDGTRLGVVVLLAITLLVQGAFVAFFLHLRRCARRAADEELETEWSRLQRSPRTS